MNELGRGLSAWLSEAYSGAPSFARGGRAENPLLWLVRAGIKNDFEEVVFPEYPELSEWKACAFARGREVCVVVGLRVDAVWAVCLAGGGCAGGGQAAEARLGGAGDGDAAAAGLLEADGCRLGLGGRACAAGRSPSASLGRPRRPSPHGHGLGTWSAVGRIFDC